MAPGELKILHIDSERSWRGGQQQVFYLHEALIKQGYKSVLACNVSSELSKKCLEKSLPFLKVKMRGEWDIFASYKLANYCKKNNINILQAHSAHALSIALIAKLFYSQVKLIGVRRVDFHIKKNFFSQLKYNNTRIDKIVCISEFIKKILIEDGVEEEKLYTIRSGTDINKFSKAESSIELKRKLSIEEEDIVLGTVAAFAGHKDYPNLINAFKLISQQKQNVKLCLIGDGPLKKNIENMVNELKLNEDIIFCGFQEDVGQYLKMFDIFILSSKKEGLGTSLIDALSIGLPIVASESGGIPEIIDNGNNGILVEPKNSKRLAEAIINLIDDKEKRKGLSEKALKSVKQFSIETTVEKNIELYKYLLS